MIKNKIKFYFADLNNIKDLTKILKGNSCLINIASIGFGSASKIVRSCENAHIKRVIFISSTSIFTKLNARSKKIRINAEKTIINSNLNYILLLESIMRILKTTRMHIKII